MINQLISQAFNGFSLLDLPFLIIQLTTSSILAIIVRFFWLKNIEEEERIFLKFLVPFQLVLTLMALFSLRSPWIIVLFGILSLLPLIGKNNFGYRSKVFYTLIVFISFGIGGGYFVVTILSLVVFIFPIILILK